MSSSMLRALLARVVSKGDAGCRIRSSNLALVSQLAVLFVIRGGWQW